MQQQEALKCFNEQSLAHMYRWWMLSSTAVIASSIFQNNITSFIRVVFILSLNVHQGLHKNKGGKSDATVNAHRSL